MSDLEESERKCQIHKERALKLEQENAREFETRNSERQVHVRSLRELEESLSRATFSNKQLQGNISELEKHNTKLNSELTQARGRELAVTEEMESIRSLLSAERKALQKAKASIQKGEESLANVLADQEKERAQYQDKISHLKSISGQRKQSIIELSDQLKQDKLVRERLSADLQNSTNKCSAISEELQQLKDKVAFTNVI